MAVKFGTEEWTKCQIGAKLHPHRCNVSPLMGEKLQNAAGNKNRASAVIVYLTILLVGSLISPLFQQTTSAMQSSSLDGATTRVID